PTIVALLFRRVGDSLMATPALRFLKQLRPNARIIVLCERQVHRIFEENPAVSEIVELRPLKSIPEFLRALKLVRRFQPYVVLDFLSDPRSALLTRASTAPMRIGIGYRGRRWAFTHLVPCQNSNHPTYSALHKLKLAEPFGEITQADCTPEIFLKAKDEEAALELWKQNDWTANSKVIAFGVFSRREHKRWPRERFAEVARVLLRKYDAAIALLAGQGENTAQQVCELVSDKRACVVQPTDLGILAACLKKSRLFIGNDGGPKHLAVAVGTPTIALFGAEPTEFWTPPNISHHIALGGIQSGENGLFSVTTEDVLQAAYSLLDNEH
ncbi:glycosyltransferase family 9 protein, partial [bacterium]|nr:glycosyltransferase family 9 protein [bacterium]